MNDLRPAAQEVASDLRQLARDNRERYPDLAPALHAYADILQRAMDASSHADPGPRGVIVLHMVYPDGAHTGDCAGCLWSQERPT